MTKFAVAIAVLALGLTAVRADGSDRLADLYMSIAIVTGQGEKNRQPGFRDCFDNVLVRVSGDQRLPKLPAAAKLRERAGEFVASFSYHDRLAGKPIHDEQGTYDRPHDLICRYDPQTLDRVLAELGSHPWLGKRPTFAIILDVERSGQTYRVSADNRRDLAMRESFALGAAPLAMTVSFPSSKVIDGLDMDKSADAAEFKTAARGAGADLPLIGNLRWSDRDLGWVADWRFAAAGKTYAWTVRGVNFDEAFRVALRGAAQILSGNGAPM
jgi:hypothetical protein